MKKLIVTILAFFAITTSVCAQVVGQEEMIKKRAAEKVGQMLDYIKYMADKSHEIQSRKRRRVKARNLFIANCNEYVEDGVKKDGVMMQVTSKNRSKVGQPLMRDYFESLVEGKLDYIYTNVKIEATEIADIKVGNLRKLNDTAWVCTCEYSQAFVGWRDRRPVYKDITTKRITCYIIPEQTEDGWEYIIKLGDVYAIKTV